MRPRYYPLIVAVLVITALAGPSTSQSLVADVSPPNANEDGSTPNGFTTFQGRGWFLAFRDNTHELWSTDGTSGGTVLEHIFSTPDETPELLGASDTCLFLRIRESVNNSYRKLSSFIPGGSLTDIYMTNAVQLRVVGITSTHMYYLAEQGQLLASAGVTSTLPLAPTLIGAVYDQDDGFVALPGGRIVFLGLTSNPTTRALWVSDATQATTFQLSAAINVQQLASFNGTVYALGGTLSSSNAVLWQTDGTVGGTSLVQAFGTDFPFPQSRFVVTPTQMYFMTVSISSRTLWLSDGTTGGTVPAAFSVPPTASISGSVGDKALLSEHQVKMWVSDGTVAGSFPITSPAFWITQFVIDLGQHAIFRINQQNSMWTTDGTIAGTGPLIPPPGQTPQSTSGAMTLGGNAVFGYHGAAGDEPWISDGTPAGTQMLINLAPPDNFGSTPDDLTAFGSSVLFTANDGTTGRELWISDGNGATQLIDVIAGPQSGLWPDAEITLLDDQALFVANGSATGRELYITNGTPAGTQMVIDIEPAGDSEPHALTRFDGKVWFAATTNAHGTEMWCTDGTAAGTKLFLDLEPGATGSNATPIDVINGELLFRATTGSGEALWTTDGTPLGITFLALADGLEFTRVDNLVFFVARRTYTGPSSVQVVTSDLWVTNGTMAGTTLLKSFDAQGGNLDPQLGNLTAFDGRLFFRAVTLLDGAELWQSDGTVAGTTILRNISPGPFHSVPDQELAAADDTLFFSARNLVHGYELWQTDGTAAGTGMVVDQHPGSANGSPLHLKAIGLGANILYSVDDPLAGRDLATSNGSASGTSVLNIATSQYSSSPKNFVTVGTQAFFVADDGTHGEELWKVPLATISASMVHPVGSGCPGTGGETPVAGSSGAPRTGNQTFALTVSNAAPLSIGLLGLSNAQANVPLGGSCLLQIGAGPIDGFLTTASGQGSVPVPIPNTPALQGTQLFHQFFVVDANGAALGFGTVTGAGLILIGD